MTAPSTDRAAIAAIIKAVKAAGWTLDYVDNGEDNVPTYDTAQIALNAVFEVDEALLHVTRGSADDAERGGEPPERGYVYLVLGNEPFEVAADYTVNLEQAIGPLMEGWNA